MNTQEEINRLDLAYQKLSGHKFKSNGIITGREYGWRNFIEAGFKVVDLETVILHIKKKILDGYAHEPRLAWRRLIGDVQIFEDELATALAEKRNLKPTPSPKERVVAQCRPVAVESARIENTARPIRDWIAELRRSVAG